MWGSGDVSGVEESPQGGGGGFGGRVDRVSGGGGGAAEVGGWLSLGGSLADRPGPRPERHIDCRFAMRYDGLFQLRGSAMNTDRRQVFTLLAGALACHPWPGPIARHEPHHRLCVFLHRA